MKRVLVFVLALVLVMSVSAVCFAAGGKVAIVTNTVSQNEEEYRSAQGMIAKYGDRIVHETWPDNFMTEQEQMISILAKIATDLDVKAVIINQGVPGTNAAIDKLLETRKDVFIVYCHTQENPPDSAKRANVILQPNTIRMGTDIPVQANKLGAKTLVHYSFPRHMSQPLLSARREIMKKKCAELGMEFVDATAPDPTGDAGLPGAQQFILEDTPKMVEKYGKDTAFYSTNCGMQIPLIKAVVDTGAIYPIPCCPSPFHGFPAALGITTDRDNPDALKYVVEETKRIAKEKGVEGRLSTWPVSTAMMFTAGATDYAMMIMDGKANLNELNLELFKKCLSDFAQVDVDIEPLVDNGVEIPNFLFASMGFLVF